MALDQYSLCPCGSGKKIKFCKCFDNLQEMVKVERMIEGDQSIAAIDRINHLLKTFPSDAWLYAFKCELLLRLQEIEPLEEASAKFIRLRPDNPLARMFRALVAIIRQNPEEAATLLLQAMSDSGDVMHPMYMTVSTNLIESLMQRGMVMSALMHCELLMDISEEISDVGQRIFQSIMTQEDANLLVRETPPSPSESEDAAWSERFREAFVLLNRYQVSHAKTKLEALQREFGQEPQILIALLNCKLLLADQEGASQLCQKLADSSMLPDAQRIYYQALKFEFDPAGSGVSENGEITEYSIENDSEIESKLQACGNLLPNKNENTRQMIMQVAGEEVPPKHAFAIAFPVLDERFAEYKPRSTSGWLALFGRQTDKAPRIVVTEPGGVKSEAVQALLRDLGLSNKKVLNVISSPYFISLQTSVMIEKPADKPVQMEMDQAIKKAHLSAFMNYSFRALDGKTPIQAAGDTTYSIKLRALLVHWQAVGRTTFDDSDFDRLHEELGLSRPSLDATQDLFDQVGGASYFWANLASIDAQSLLQLMQSAFEHRVHSVFAKYSDRAKTMDWPAEMKQAAEYIRLNMDLRKIKDLDEAEKTLLNIYHTGKAMGLTVGNAVLERIDVLNELNRTSEARVFMEQALKEVPNDPVLLQFMQMAMYRMQQMQQQAAGAGGDLSQALLRHGRSGPASPASSSSGLWTPGQSEAPAPASQSSSGSGSKLWIPGQ